MASGSILIILPPAWDGDRLGWHHFFQGFQPSLKTSRKCKSQKWWIEITVILGPSDHRLACLTQQAGHLSCLSWLTLCFDVSIRLINSDFSNINNSYYWISAGWSVLGAFPRVRLIWGSSHLLSSWGLVRGRCLISTWWFGRWPQTFLTIFSHLTRFLWLFFKLVFIS